MTGTSTIQFSNRSQLDLRRITSELTDLQRQVATGAKANDLVGFGGASGRIISARGLREAAEVRSATLGQVESRLAVQGAALGQVSDVSRNLAQTIREALSANDGRGIGDALESAFSNIVAALNEQWNNQPLFAGERTGQGPVVVGTLEELRAAAVPSAWFAEADRAQVIDAGGAAPVQVADKASELASDLFQTIRLLSDMVEGAGGAIGTPIDLVERTHLQSFADDLDAAAGVFNNAEGRAGQLQKRFEDERVRLQARSDLLTKTIGDHADADLAEVSLKLNALMVQYEATAKTIADLSNLTLLNYL